MMIMMGKELEEKQAAGRCADSQSAHGGWAGRYGPKKVTKFRGMTGRFTLLVRGEQLVR